jgi:hypothetical protein
MYAYDIKITRAYQQELIRIAAVEDPLQNDEWLHQSLYQIIKRVSGGVGQQENGVIPRLIRGQSFDFIFKSRFLSSFFR